MKCSAAELRHYGFWKTVRGAGWLADVARWRRVLKEIADEGTGVQAVSARIMFDGLGADALSQTAARAHGHWEGVIHISNPETSRGSRPGHYGGHSQERGRCMDRIDERVEIEQH